MDEIFDERSTANGLELLIGWQGFEKPTWELAAGLPSLKEELLEMRQLEYDTAQVELTRLRQVIGARKLAVGRSMATYAVQLNKVTRCRMQLAKSGSFPLQPDKAMTSSVRR